MNERTEQPKLDEALEQRAATIVREFENISRQESRIIALREAGKRNGEIARLLDISPAAVDNHTSHIRHKMNAARSEKLEVMFLKPRQKNKEENP